MAKLYRWLSVLGLLLTIGFIPMLIMYKATRSEDAVTIGEQILLGLCLALFFALLIIPGRGAVARREARWLAAFLLVLAGLLMLWTVTLLPVLHRYLLDWETFDEQTLLVVARVARMLAIVGTLALAAKGVALAVPYVRKYQARLSDLSGFDRPIFPRGK